MRAPLTREYIESFVETCMDMGLSKEATAELLQHRSALHAAEQSPAFAEGYAAARSSMPVSSMVRARPGYAEKRASGGFKLIGQGLRSIASGIGTIGRSAGNRVLDSAIKHPTATSALTKSLGYGGMAGGGYLLHNHLNDRRETPGVPVLPGSYNPEAEKKEYQTRFNRDSSGIAEVNRTINESAARRKVLQQAVDSNSPNSAQALTELQALNAKVNAATSTRQKYLDELTARGATASERLNAIQARKQQLIERQKSPFWRGLHWATFRNPDKSYTEALNELQGPAARLSHDNQLIKDLKTRVPYYQGVQYNEPSSVQMQRQFFAN